MALTFLFLFANQLLLPRRGAVVDIKYIASDAGSSTISVMSMMGLEWSKQLKRLATHPKASLLHPEMFSLNLLRRFVV